MAGENFDSLLWILNRLLHLHGWPSYRERLDNGDCEE